MKQEIDYFEEKILPAVVKRQVEKAKLVESQLETEETALSDEFYKNLDHVLEDYDAKLTNRKQRRFLKRMAACFLAVVVIPFTFAVSVSALKIPFLDWVFAGMGNFSIAKPSGAQIEYDPAMIPEGWDYIYVPSFVPSGFKFDDYYSSRKYFTIVYSSTSLSTNITFEQKNNIEEFFVDDENADITETEINGRSAYLRTKEKSNILYWNNGDYSFSLTSELNVSDMKMIAKSMIKLSSEGS